MMKKIILIVVLSSFLCSCGPKRMSCYGKRCVDTTIKKDVAIASKVNS